mmetsp:Transcript_42704/g.100672  ORF Transcript_42704/g.100672 Transcript_42704/m.100672 type:complete len:194 (-) Transcript_42704:32-613(-)
MSNNYYDLHSIFCEEASVPVTFKYAIPDELAQILDAKTTNGNSEVKELPLWLTRELSSRHFLEHHTPRAFRQKELSKLKAGAAAVPLGQRHPYFYDLGIEVAKMDADQAGQELVDRLSAAFRERYKVILDRFQNTDDRNSAKFLQTLTISEQKIYLAGQQAARHHQKWLKRKLEIIEEAAIVGLAKRTRTHAI